MDNEPKFTGLGSSDSDPAEVARETERYRAAVQRTPYDRPQLDAALRELGPEVRIVSSTGRRPGSWEQLSSDARLANVGMDEADGHYRRGFDPDSVEAESRQLGRAQIIAKHR